MALPAEIIEQVRRRANFACEYCGVTDKDSAGQLTVDHFRPRSRGGSDGLDNLLYCCYRCNLFKGDYWPQGPSAVALWNPRVEPMETHLLLLANGKLYPISPTGDFTLERLRLNRQELVDYRLGQRFDDEESEILAQHRAMLESLKQLKEQYKEAIEEHIDLMRQERGTIDRLPDGNGRANGEGAGLA